MSPVCSSTYSEEEGNRANSASPISSEEYFTTLPSKSGRGRFFSSKHRISSSPDDEESALIPPERGVRNPRLASPCSFESADLPLASSLHRRDCLSPPPPPLLPVGHHRAHPKVYGGHKHANYPYPDLPPEEDWRGDTPSPAPGFFPGPLDRHQNGSIRRQFGHCLARQDSAENLLGQSIAQPIEFAHKQPFQEAILMAGLTPSQASLPRRRLPVTPAGLGAGQPTQYSPASASRARNYSPPPPPAPPMPNYGGPTEVLLIRDRHCHNPAAYPADYLGRSDLNCDEMDEAVDGYPDELVEGAPAHFLHRRSTSGHHLSAPWRPKAAHTSHSIPERLCNASGMEPEPLRPPPPPHAAYADPYMRKSQDYLNYSSSRPLMRVPVNAASISNRISPAPSPPSGHPPVYFKM